MKLKVIVAAAVVAMSSSAVFAADVAAGKAKAAVCAGCHGPDGISFVPNYPNLAGQKAAYTEKQLKAFKDKTRVDPVMNGQAAALNDADIKNLAAFYESLGKK
ncbi:cytochrome c [Aliikangiella sp. G2MR2-5]|uniref:c-type cytochrome n=1 Tax=Aliikangiella sp. G2MR2-5 TaxID=2788943 RepID=UPI0018AC04C0|nr:cytochrome c [Aliikangiella sp. G2MR2-5]